MLNWCKYKFTQQWNGLPLQMVADSMTSFQIRVFDIWEIVDYTLFLLSQWVCMFSALQYKINWSELLNA